MTPKFNSLNTEDVDMEIGVYGNGWLWNDLYKWYNN